jgi:hypothetical protein
MLVTARLVLLLAIFPGSLLNVSAHASSLDINRSCLALSPTTPLERSGSPQFMSDHAGDGRRVLTYLREMAQYCHESRRRDLAWQYESAVELVTQVIYGKLPPRAEIKYPIPPPEIRTRTVGQMQMLSRPYQKVIRLVTVAEDGFDFTYEELACGHLSRALVGDSIGKRRRCAACASDQIASKKKPSSVTLSAMETKRRSALATD